MNNVRTIWSGQCTCGAITVELSEPPLFVHACHCLDCQASTGSTFSLSAIVIARSVSLHGIEPGLIQLSPRTTRLICSQCQLPLYLVSTAFPATLVLKLASIGDTFPPQAHIWTKRKQPWLPLADGVPTFAEGYQREQLWSEESLHRMRQAERGLSDG